MTVDLAEELRALCGRVRRLMPLSSNPEAFHIEKDQVCADLARLARKLDPSRERPQTGRIETVEQVRVNGRLVTVQHRRASFRISTRSD